MHADGVIESCFTPGRYAMDIIVLLLTKPIVVLILAFFFVLF